MKTATESDRIQVHPGDLPGELPKIELNHGQTLWLLTALGFRGDASPDTFREYVKSLRKLGMPFEHGEIGQGHRGLAIYSYCHLMELALGLTLRVYHVAPDSVLTGVIRFRKSLCRQYQQAYAERCTGRGTPIVIKTGDYHPFQVSGVYLDLRINFAGGTLVRFGPPQLISPYQALSTYATHDLPARALLPICLSRLSERVVALSLHAPLIRRGHRLATERLNRELA
jgi:hypothetical protein